MSVVGVGTDIIDIRRIENMAEKVRERLAKRILTASELVRYGQHNQAARFLAKRWAGKEAAAKALGTGIGAGVSFQHFIIEASPSGQPILQISSQALEQAKALKANSWHISLSDEAHYATAFVVLSN